MHCSYSDRRNQIYALLSFHRKTTLKIYIHSLPKTHTWFSSVSVGDLEMFKWSHCSVASWVQNIANALTYCHEKHKSSSHQLLVCMSLFSLSLAYRIALNLIRLYLHDRYSLCLKHLFIAMAMFWLVFERIFSFAEECSQHGINETDPSDTIH